MTDYFKKYPMENSKIIQLMRINSEPKTQSNQDPSTTFSNTKSDPAMKVSNAQSDQDPPAASSVQSNKDPHEDSIPRKLR